MDRADRRLAERQSVRVADDVDVAEETDVQSPEPRIDAPRPAADRDCRTDRVCQRLLQSAGGGDAARRVDLARAANPGSGARIFMGDRFERPHADFPAIEATIGIPTNGKCPSSWIHHRIPIVGGRCVSRGMTARDMTIQMNGP